MTRRLRDLAAAHATSLADVALAAGIVLLHRCTGETDIAVGTQLSDRPRPRLAAVGNFANVVVLRTPVDARGTFGELVDAVRDRAAAAREHRDAPFDEVVRTVRAAGHDDVPAGVLLRPRHEVGQSPAEMAGGGRQRLRGERPEPASDHHDPGVDPMAVGAGDHDAVRLAGELGRLPIEQVHRVVSAGLGDERGDQLAAAHRGETSHVVDHLLRVHRGDLATGLGQGVHQCDGHPAEPGVVGAEQPHRPRPDDQHVHVRVGSAGHVGSFHRRGRAPWPGRHGGGGAFGASSCRRCPVRRCPTRPAPPLTGGSAGPSGVVGAMRSDSGQRSAGHVW
ncbi:condensation domain-containing protein [Frankia sp. AgKG'84/4]|uniref:condensation domain-containing protein n=1 Tax=Frankia sp. AgKG'84/4 TaxID=573490 RepID=UPI0035B4B034